LERLQPQIIFWIACWVIVIVSLGIGCDNLLSASIRNYSDI